MKIDAISKFNPQKLLRNIAVATPLLVLAPVISALERNPVKDKFERIIPIIESDDFSPAVKVGKDTVYPAVVVDKSENQLYYYDLGGELDTLFTVGLGKASTPTDIGLKRVVTIEEHPYADSPKATKRHKTPDEYGSRVIVLENIDTKTGEVVGFNEEFIHGTNKPESVGKNQSKGCIRMNNKDVEKLADWLTEGQYVLVRE